MLRGRLARGDARQFLVFLAAGGLAAALNWLSRIALSTVMAFGPAVVVAHLIGMVVAFLGMRAFAFRVSGPGAGQEFGRFFLVNMVSIAQTWAVSELFLLLLAGPVGNRAVAEAAAHGIGIASTVMTSYWLHRRFTFRQPRR
jgi:putative flippase GtrA